MFARLHLSLTAPGIERVALTQWFMSLITIGCLIVTGFIWWYGRELNEKITKFNDGIIELQQVNQKMRVEAAAQGLDLSDSRIQALSKEVVFAKQLRQQQTFSWTEFLNDLESAVPSNVSMDSIVLNFKEASISLAGSTATLKDLNRLVDRLEAHPAFHQVVLSRHTFKTKKGKTEKHRVLLFTMTVSYLPV